MAAGFLTAHGCFPTTAMALQSFNTGYPLQSGLNFFYLTSSSINATGLITATVKNDAGTTVINAKTLQLLPCDTQNISDISSAMLIIYMAFAALLGFVAASAITSGWSK